MKLGRNDPCHCGSGKKYKKCHMAQDEQQRVALRPPTVAEEPPPAPAGPEEALKLLGHLARNGPAKDRAAFREMAAEAQPLLDYYARREEIEAASTELEAHREEFDRLASDEPAYLARVAELFDEERFAPLRFTAADIRRAFDKVGYPAGGKPDDDVVAHLRAAILFLADTPYRSRCSMFLLQHLPTDVAAGRYLDGWILQASAYEIMESPKESHPFLFQMFGYGYDAWQHELAEANRALLREAGLDPERLQAMTMDEIDAWLQTRAADPRRTALLEKALKERPEQMALSQANLARMERDSANLLDRPDAGELLLSPPELDPWVPVLMERFAEFQTRVPRAIDNSPSSEADSEAFVATIGPVFQEMAETIFTPPRMQELISRLRRYRNARFEAGDKDAASQAMSAIMSLEREKEPSRNWFLMRLCFASLGRLAEAGADPAPEEEEPTAANRPGD